MKKIDLHIHTVSTAWDNAFTFDLDTLKKYVSEIRLDAIAITNHNVFDIAQFKEITNTIETVVFPGIELSITSGHILIISNTTDLDDFEHKTNLVAQKNRKIEDSISIKELQEIFGDLNDYLVIPHYDKKPAIKGEILNQILNCVSAGEVDSAKKFIRAIKDNKKLTPVLFSDVRIHNKLNSLPTRQTFIDCGELTFNAIKECLKDKKVALSEADGNKLFPVFDDGQMLSTGLNVLLGERSTGKTFTLDKIKSVYGDNAQYIEQFSLVQQDDEAFNNNLQKRRSQFIDNYLLGFKAVLDDITKVDLRSNERDVENYIASLLTSADEADRKDTFSKTALFDESEFPKKDDKVLVDLIGSVIQVVENVQYRAIIDKNIDRDSMKRLACELIETLRKNTLDAIKKEHVNELIRDIGGILKRHTSAVPVEKVDLYRISMDRRKVDRFSEIVKFLQRNAIVSEEKIQGFKVIVQKGAFSGAGEIKSASNIRASFKTSFEKYNAPYDYLLELMKIEALPRSDIYKLFAKIKYKILNRDGYEVSGGERSEFRLLQEINDAQNHEILLIDEPESSFDNLFLKSEVNQIIKEISTLMPVVVVTHNSTVGASINADYLLYASKEIEGGKVVYRLYSGYPNDHQLTALDGNTISNYEKTMNSLEAGNATYNDRRKKYEALRD